MNAPAGDSDLVPIADLDRLSRVYLTRAEADAGGLISLRTLDERRRRSEGRAVAMSDSGEVHVRTVLTRNGQRVITTSSEPRP